MRAVLASFGLLVALSGCSKQAGSFTPAMRAFGSADTVYADAVAWSVAQPGRYWANVAPTHSMEPVINEHSVILCVRYTGQTFANGAVAVINEGPAYPHVLHVVADQSGDSVIMSGYNNGRSDGWFPKKNIEGLVVGQLYLPN